METMVNSIYPQIVPIVRIFFGGFKLAMFGNTWKWTNKDKDSVCQM